MTADLDDGLSSRAGASSFPGLCERNTAEEAITKLLGAAAKKKGGVLFVVGEAGLGKTALLTHALDQASKTFRVCKAKGDALESSLPFSLLGQALENIDRAAVLSLVGGGVELSSGALAAHFHRILHWLEDITPPPLLIALDDVHWADQNSLALLSFLSRRLSMLRVAVIATLRPWPSEAAERAAELSKGADIVVQRLGPLTQQGASDFIEKRVGGSVPPEASTWAWDFCGGNPFLLGHLGDALSHSQDVKTVEERVQHLLSAELLLTFFGPLPPEVIRLIQAASLFGESFIPLFAAEVAKLDEEELEFALDAAWRSGLLRQASGPNWKFVHPLFWRVLRETLGPPFRHVLHARAFRVLNGAGREAEAAEHAIRAHPVGNPEAIALLERVGRLGFEEGDLQTAVSRLEAAADLAGDRATSSLLLRLSEALLASGRFSDARKVCYRVLATPGITVKSRVYTLRILGGSLFESGEIARAKERFEEALTLAESVADAGVVTEIVLEQAIMSWFVGGPASSLPLAVRARRISAKTGRGLERRAQGVWGLIALISGDPAGVKAIEAAGTPFIDEPRAHITEAYSSLGPPLILGLGSTVVEHFSKAERAFVVGLEMTEEAGARPIAAMLAACSAYLKARLGRLTEALRLIELTAVAADLPVRSQTYSAAVYAYVLLHMGRLQQSEEWCRRSQSLSQGAEGWMALQLAREVRGHRYLREGAVEEACKVFQDAEVMQDRLNIGEPCTVPWASHGIAAAIRGQRFQVAERLLEWIGDRADKFPCIWPKIVLARGRAKFAAEYGDHETADAYFESALTLHHGLQAPLEQIETLLDYGTFLRRTGKPARARPLLSEALALADQSGAAWLGGYALSELAASGGRRRRATNARYDLTPQERRVASLASAGLSNREIANRLVITVATVETHLLHIYAKLNIHSRRELIARFRNSQISAPHEAKDQGNP